MFKVRLVHAYLRDVVVLVVMLSLIFILFTTSDYLCTRTKASTMYLKVTLLSDAQKKNQLSKLKLMKKVITVGYLYYL